jgi:hypothetical protein
MKISIESKQFVPNPIIVEAGADENQTEIGQELPEDAPGVWTVVQTATDDNGTRCGRLFIDGPANATDEFLTGKILEAYGITPAS